MIRFNSFLDITEHENYLFFDFNTSDWVKLKKIYLSCICTENLTVQVITLCPSPLQYRHRLFCIQWVFSVTDSDSQRWGWAVKRFIEFLPVAETVTHWVIAKNDVKMLKNELSDYANWGVVMWEWELLCVICKATQWQLLIICKVCVNSLRFKPVIFTVIRS